MELVKLGFVDFYKLETPTELNLFHKTFCLRNTIAP